MAGTSTMLDPALVLLRARFAISGSIFQGVRLMALVESQKAYPARPETWTAQQVRDFDKANRLTAEGDLVEDIEAFFFLSILRLAISWLEPLRASFPSVAKAIDEFTTAVPHARDLRDMRVHEDDYLAGKGRVHGRYRHNFDALFETSAHSIVTCGDDYLLGGRLNVPEALSALRRLLAVIDAQPK
jgi:hypothetical protein